MLVVRSNGQEFGVVWEHFNDATKCGIFLLPEERGGEKRELVIGWAYLHPTDTYVREVGRKRSLTKALASFEKGVRQRFWEAYHGRKKGKATGNRAESN